VVAGTRHHPMEAEWLRARRLKPRVLPVGGARLHQRVDAVQCLDLRR
jgi:hypothetical protein